MITLEIIKEHFSEKRIRKLARAACNGHQHAFRYHNMLSACMTMANNILSELGEIHNKDIEETKKHITLEIISASLIRNGKVAEIEAKTASGIITVIEIEVNILNQMGDEKNENFQELVDMFGVARAVKIILS